MRGARAGRWRTARPTPVAWPIKAILFDKDGTLTDYRASWLAACSSLYWSAFGASGEPIRFHAP